MMNNIGVVVRFYYNKTMNPFTFSGIKNVEHKGNIICDFSNMIPEKDKSDVGEDWTYIPMKMLNIDVSEDKFVELIKNQDDNVMFKISEYTESEFNEKQVHVYDYEDKSDNDIVESCDNNCFCGGCKHCSGCSSH